MAFSSFPAYLDHPNLHQFQQPDHQQGSGVVENNHLPPPPPFAVGGGSIRPGSMVDRARLAKLPLPEAGLKCPRCDSTNTKFCYFNNYSLTQPRHFCKTCRRYWTRGGALRNVPVGGGCRRNKKTKSNSSKSSITTAERPQIMASNCTNTANTSNHFPQQTNHQLPLMVGLQNLNHYGGGFQAQMMPTSSGNGLSNMGFNLGGNGNNDLSAQWKLPSSIGGFEPPTSLFPPFQGEGVDASSSFLGDQQIVSLAKSSAEISQEASVKTEENPLGLNLTKQFLVSSENNQFWGGSPWTGFSGLNSSSNSHLL